MVTDALGTFGPGPTGVVSAQDHRLAITATLTGLSTGVLDARTGVFPGPNSLALVTGTSATAPMTVAVAAFQAATARSSASGTYLGPTLEAPTTVNIAAAPGSNSRIDVVYVLQQDADTTVPSPDGTTAPTVAVKTGTAAASPTKPSIPIGALELATVTVAAGATSTNGAGVTIANTARQTVMAGGVMPVRSTDASLPAYDGHTRYLPGTGLQVGVGSTWGPPNGIRPGRRYTRNSVQVLSAATWAAYVWDSTPDGTGGAGMWASGTPTRAICTKAGRYAITFTVDAADVMMLRLNSAGSSSGGTVLAYASNNPGTLATGEVVLAVNDYIEGFVYRASAGNTGGPAPYTASMSLTFIDS